MDPRRTAPQHKDSPPKIAAASRRVGEPAHNHFELGSVDPAAETRLRRRSPATASPSPSRTPPRPGQAPPVRHRSARAGRATHSEARSPTTGRRSIPRPDTHMHYGEAARDHAMRSYSDRAAS